MSDNAHNSVTSIIGKPTWAPHGHSMMSSAAGYVPHRLMSISAVVGFPTDLTSGFDNHLPTWYQ